MVPSSFQGAPGDKVDEENGPKDEENGPKDEEGEENGAGPGGLSVSQKSMEAIFLQVREN